MPAPASTSDVALPELERLYLEQDHSRQAMKRRGHLVAPPGLYLTIIIT